MRMSSSVVASCVLVLLLPLRAAAISDQQFRSIQALGELNGVALQCGFIKQTRRMKKALVETLPKRRALGQSFEDVTNQSYLRFIENGNSCPDAVEFSGRVGAAIDNLKQAFLQ